MNILITGAKGFIGKHLNEFLTQKYKNYNIFSPSSKELDLLDEVVVEHFIIKNKIDLIIHLANLGGGRNTLSMQNLVEYNLRMFFNIAKHSNKVKKIISFGSGAEYGKHRPIINAKEVDTLFLPLDSYGFYKQIISKFVEQSSNMIHLRVFGVYGKYEDYRFRFISNTILKDLLNMPIMICQNVLFDYIYINDLLTMIDYCLHNNMKYKIYNATSGDKIDLLTLAQLIVKDKNKISILNEGLNNEYTSNNKRILQEIKKFSFTSFENAIEEMRIYFKTNLQNLDLQALHEDSHLHKIKDIWKNIE